MNKKILVLGSMNNLPTCYAADFAELGGDVIQIVGFSKKYELHDPINFLSQDQLKKLKIMFLPFLHNFILPVVARLYYYTLKLKLPKSWCPDLIIFNDSYITMAKFFPDTKKIFLPHGGDIETWCGFNTASPESLSISMSGSGIFQLMPSCLRQFYISYIMKSFREALYLMDEVIYFPEDFTEVTRKISKFCNGQNISYVERYDISLAPLANMDISRRDYKESKLSDVFKILVPVRFSYKTFPEGNSEFNKGSDLIIHGINKFLNEVDKDSNIEVVCYEKGADVNDAKVLISELPLLNAVLTWQPPLPFNNFLLELKEANFCFDGVGSHWPGAVAAYALALGVNVGANFSKVRHLLPDHIPHLHSVMTINEISKVLMVAYKERVDYRVDENSVENVRRAYSTMNVAKKTYGKI
jgi:hypothetical protein